MTQSMLENQQQQQDDPQQPPRTELAFAGVIIPKLFSLASMIGSCIIVHSIVGTRQSRNQKLRATIFYRLLLALFIYDIISSMAYFAGTWMMPTMEPPPTDDWLEWDVYFQRAMKYPWTYGNQATCQIQGYLLQVGMSGSTLFTGWIAVQYVLVVRYKWREHAMKYAERIFFTMGITFPLLSASYSLSLQLFHSVANGYCWINQYPIICSEYYYNLNTTIEVLCHSLEEVNSDDDNKVQDSTLLLGDSYGYYISEEQSNFYQYLFGYYIIFAALLLIIISMFLLFLTVREQELRSSQWSDAAREGRDQVRVIIKAIWFISMFLVIYIPPTVFDFLFTRISSQTPSIASYVLDMITNICLSSQGMLNVIVLSKPTFQEQIVRLCPCCGRCLGRCRGGINPTSRLRRRRQQNPHQQDDEERIENETPNHNRLVQHPTITDTTDTKTTTNIENNLTDTNGNSDFLNCNSTADPVQPRHYPSDDLDADPTTSGISITSTTYHIEHHPRDDRNDTILYIATTNMDNIRSNNISNYVSTATIDA